MVAAPAPGRPVTATKHRPGRAGQGQLINKNFYTYTYQCTDLIGKRTEFYAPEILDEGDGIYLDSTMGHAYLNAGEAASAKGVCLCTSEAPDLYDQLRQIASRDEAPAGEGQLPP